jgi:hypothetical protein
MVHPLLLPICTYLGGYVNPQKLSPVWQIQNLNLSPERPTLLLTRGFRGQGRVEGEVSAFPILWGLVSSPPAQFGAGILQSPWPPVHISSPATGRAAVPPGSVLGESHFFIHLLSQEAFQLPDRGLSVPSLPCSPECLCGMHLPPGEQEGDAPA